MESGNGIPIVIGVTGHRQLREEDRPALTEAVKLELKKLQALCPHSQLVMLNSLAEGADLLCADAARELGLPLIAALPFALDRYALDFSGEGREKLLSHCARAREVFVAPPTERPPEEGETRAYLFRQAGIYVAAHCHVLLALWDGKAGSAAACGTAEAVDFALNGNYAPFDGLVLRSAENGAVIHVSCPRDAKAAEKAGNVRTLGNWNAVCGILEKTDEFNRSAAALPPDQSSRLPEGADEDATLARMDALSRAAGTLSRQNARRYRRVLALLAAASSLLTFAFLLYDEAQAIGMIVVCGLMLLAAWGLLRFAARSGCHRRYLDCRVLAEWLRVQSYLRYAGSRTEVPALLSWTQRTESAWLVDALCALNAAGAPVKKHEIRDCWAEAQRSYHQAAAQRAERKLRSSERTVRAALFVSVTLYLAALCFELLCGGQLLKPLLPVAQAEAWRTALKLLLGTLSAVTLFVANYYGRLSLPRAEADHRKMEKFYAFTSERLRRFGQDDTLLRQLAAQELMENGNWRSYQEDNKPEINL